VRSGKLEFVECDAKFIIRKYDGFDEKFDVILDLCKCLGKKSEQQALAKYGLDYLWSVSKQKFVSYVYSF